MTLVQQATPNFKLRVPFDIEGEMLTQKIFESMFKKTNCGIYNLSRCTRSIFAERVGESYVFYYMGHLRGEIGHNVGIVDVDTSELIGFIPEITNGKHVFFHPFSDISTRKKSALIFFR